jgi:hypothetical protein
MIEYVLHQYADRVATRYLIVGKHTSQIVSVHEMLRQWTGDDLLDIHGVYLITPEGAVVSVQIDDDNPSFYESGPRYGSKRPGYTFIISQYDEETGEGPVLERIMYYDGVDEIDLDDLDNEICEHFVYVNGFPELVDA